jgi:hypothetical protein
MTKTQGFYITYLERLAKQREERGEAPAPDVHDSEYWKQRRQNEEEKNARR